ncbi:MAG: ketoacyl-ACP synthase III [Candidatus Cloacimonetes bacterium]|nr:ketoacyl-ACP synthase III [Candidatus Cloacimonadota bacterium]
MAYFSHQGVAITALAAAVPKQIFNNLTDNPHFQKEDVEAIVAKTGIYQRRVAPEGMCASDLCFQAAQQLIEENGIDKSEIDILIFVSQTPDYRMPATSIILQHRLGLPKSCAAFDVNLGCSGFVVGLNLAFSLAQQPAIRKVLLLNGETRTRVYSQKDRKTGFLFGDAGSACIVEKTGTDSKSYFLIDSDGEKSDYIKIDSGGYRHPSTCESVQEKVYENGSVRTDEQGYMDGNGVFEFVIIEVPRQIKKLYKQTEQTKEEIDYFVFHQANKFMNEHLVKKMKLDPDKVPFCLDRYGNTSSVSIPLTIVSELKVPLSGASKRVLISGFGVGLSLGSAILDLEQVQVSKLLEV